MLPVRSFMALGAGVLGLACNNKVQQLPENIPMPELPGTATPHLVCNAKAHRDALGAGAEQKLGAAMAPGWQRTGAFNEGQPLTSADVPASTVVPHWSPSQESLLRKLGTATGERRTNLVPLGGDYWKKTKYPIAPAGTQAWLSTAFAETEVSVDGTTRREIVNRGNDAFGDAWLELALNQPFLRISVGGDADPRVGVELLVRSADAANCRHATPSNNQGPRGFDHVVRQWRGSNQDALETQELAVYDPECPLENVTAVLHAFDHSTQGHVNVGEIALTSVALDSARAKNRTPLWGFADFHTHPTDHLGFGGLQGIHTMWGTVGGKVRDYLGPENKWRVARDVPPCDDSHKTFNAHHGGYAAATAINGVEKRISTSIEDLGDPSLSPKHSESGAPGFTEFPSRLRGSHHQQHITQLYRAYLGGLRLMTALALQNEGLEYGSGWVICSDDGDPTVDTSSDMAVIRAHVEVMRELAEMNSDWMQIAYTPEDAREIIQHNKLAVVLGVEVPRLGESDKVEQQVTELDQLGIRQVVVVHGMKNELGGTAVFQDLYNTVNDWMHRGAEYRDHIEEFSGELSSKPFGKSAFFAVDTTASPLPHDEDERLLFRLGSPRRVVLSDVFPHPSGYTYSIPILGEPISYGILHPFVDTSPLLRYAQSPYQNYGRGQRNQRGLTGRGREFIERLIQHGMLVDTAHMSDNTLYKTYKSLDEDHCEDYPVMVSHAHFRKLGVKVDYTDRVKAFVDRTAAWVHQDLTNHAYPMSECVRDHAKCDWRVLSEAQKARDQAPFMGSGTIDPEQLPSEYFISSGELAEVNDRRGVLGVFLAQGAIDNSKIPRQGARAFASDCAGSSKAFAASLLYASDALKQAGVGLATDFTMVPGASPRFGRDACGSYLSAGAGSESGSQLLETMLEPEQYQFAAQRDAVRYTSTGVCIDPNADPKQKPKNGVPCAGNDPLVPYEMGRRTFNFNFDGMANYGLLPDMLQDTANVLGAANVELASLDRVFQAPEAFVQMWERARELAGCDTPGHCATPRVALPRDRKTCGNACPKSWNGGAPLQSLGDFMGNCEPGEPVRIPGRDGTQAPRPPIYTQHRADTSKPADLTQQGDWALFWVGPNPIWTCGDKRSQALPCPSGTNYVKVRRVLDATIGKPRVDCNRQPLPPEIGNRAVFFECLAGPPLDEAAPERP